MFRRSLVFSGFLTSALISVMLFMVVFNVPPLSGIVHGSAINDDSATVTDRFLGKEILELHGVYDVYAGKTLAVTGGATVVVPLLTEITAGVTGGATSIPIDVLDVPAGDLGAYQFKLTYDPAVVTVGVTGTAVQGGDFPFDAITAVNITTPVTGGETIEWNHFQGGSEGVPALITVANVTFEPVGAAGECTTLDITVVELVDNDSVPIPNSSQDGQICLVAENAESVTDLVAAQDVDNVLLPTGVKPVITLIRDALSEVTLPGRLIQSYEANITYPVTGAASAIATDCILKSPFTGAPGVCSIGSGVVNLQASTGVTGSGVTAPVDPLAFVSLRLLGSNNPATGLTTVELTFVEILDDLGNDMPQVSPPNSRTFLRGDAQADENISIGDALFIAQHIVAPLLRPAGEGVGEVNPVNAGSVNHDSPNDVISLADAIRIAQFLVGIRDEFYNP
jgi:hypothetical protein